MCPDSSTNDNAKARLHSRALLERFQDVERLPEDQQQVVMQLMDAFLAMHKLKGYANRNAV